MDFFIGLLSSDLQFSIFNKSEPDGSAEPVCFHKRAHHADIIFRDGLSSVRVVMPDASVFSDSPDASLL